MSTGATQPSKGAKDAEDTEPTEPAQAMAPTQAIQAAQATDGQRRQEQRYRRLLTLLPQQYLARRGEEMVGVFLDHADAGQRRPGWRETLGVGRLAVRARWTAAPAPVAAGRVARAIALAGTFLFGINGIVQADFVLAHRDVLHERIGWVNSGQITPGDLDSSVYFHLYGSAARWTAYTIGLPILWALAFLALLGGARRIAALVSLAAAAPVVAMPHWWSERPVQTVMSALTLAAVVALALRRDALPGPLSATAGLLAFAATGAVLVEHESRLPYYLGFIAGPGGADSPVLWVIAAAMVVLAVFLGRVDPAWPVGMALLGVAPAIAALIPVDSWNDGSNEAGLGYFADYSGQILLAECALVAVAAAMLVRGALRARRFGDGSVQRAA